MTIAQIKIFVTKVIFLAVLVNLVAFVSLKWNVLPSQKQIARCQISDVFNQLSIGASLVEAKDLLAEFVKREPRLTLISDDRGLYLNAAPEIPGITTSWILLILTQNEKVIGKAIRVQEGWFHPCDAPLDQGQVIPAIKLSDGQLCIQ